MTVRSTRGSIVIAAVLGILAAVLAASAGMRALMAGLNVVYDRVETRRFLRLRGLALVLTLGAMVFMLLALAAVVVFPAIAGKLAVPSVVKTLISLLRWPVLALLVVVGLAVLVGAGSGPVRGGPSAGCRSSSMASLEASTRSAPPCPQPDSFGAARAVRVSTPARTPTTVRTTRLRWPRRRGGDRRT
jgi:hypothetical protein